METLRKNKYFELKYDEEKELFFSIWKGKGDSISDEEIKTEIGAAAEFIKQYKPNFIISDDSERKFLYNVNIQNWVAKTLVEANIVAGLKKFAIILPIEMIAAISTEQTAEEVLQIPYELKLFTKLEDAQKWIDESLF